MENNCRHQDWDMGKLLGWAAELAAASPPLRETAEVSRAADIFSENVRNGIGRLGTSMWQRFHLVGETLNGGGAVVAGGRVVGQLL
jgi:hypothetical protein